MRSLILLLSLAVAAVYAVPLAQPQEEITRQDEDFAEVRLLFMKYILRVYVRYIISVFMFNVRQQLHKGTFLVCKK